MNNTTAKIYLTIINLISIIAMILDKYWAKHNKRRLSEKIILLLAALGGAPGIGIIMRLGKHKNKKRSFGLIFYPILAIWIILTVLIL